MEATNYTAHHKDHEKDFTSGIVWAVFLIFVGAVLLLNTIGVLSWSVWGFVWRFWPMFLILGGIQLLLGKSRWAGIVAAVVTALVFFGILSMLLVRENIWSRDAVPGLTLLSEKVTEGFGDRDTRTDTIELDALDGAQIIEYEMRVGDGEFEVKNSDELNVLSVVSEYYERHGEPEIVTEKDGDVLKVLFKQKSNQGFFFLGYDVPQYEFRLGKTDAVCRANIELGAGSGNVDLQDVDLAELQAKVGAGRLEVTLNESVQDDAVIEIEVGAGEAIVKLPEKIGFKLDYEVGVGSIELEDENISGFGRNDKEYESKNYGTASQKITIHAKVGAGSLKIVN